MENLEIRTCTTITTNSTITPMSNRAHDPRHTVMDVLDRALAEAGNVDRIVIVMQGVEGEQIWQFSNARSTAEHQGMLVLAQMLTTGDEPR